MQVNTQPMPCPAGSSYQVSASDGTPPYSFQLIASPPNPPGVKMTVLNGVATVEVPEGTSDGASIVVIVSDSGSPTQIGYSANTVG